MLGFDVEMHNENIIALTEDLEKLGLKVVEGDTISDPHSYHLETFLYVYITEVVDNYIDETGHYRAVRETTPVCGLTISHGEVEECSLSSDFATTGSSSKFNLLSKLYNRLYND